MPLSPEWAKLPKRHCDDCNKMYKPVRPRRVINGKEEMGFCTDNCRKSYHKHGGAYRKLKTEIGKEITKQVKAAQIEFCERCQIDTKEVFEELQALNRRVALLECDNNRTPGTLRRDIGSPSKVTLADPGAVPTPKSTASRPPNPRSPK